MKLLNSIHHVTHELRSDHPANFGRLIGRFTAHDVNSPTKQWRTHVSVEFLNGIHLYVN